MAAKKKIGEPIVLVASIEQAQYEALRYIAYREKRSIADLTREALADFIAQKSQERPPTISVAGVNTAVLEVKSSAAR